MIPTLTTERLRMVPPSIGVYEQFHTDSETSVTSGTAPPVDDARARLAGDLELWQAHGFGVWVVQRQLDGAYVGTCGFWQSDGWPRELTWWLRPESRGEGIATEASRAVIRHAYEVFQWKSVETYMKDENRAAQALVLRLGGFKIDRRVFPDGLQRNVYRLPRPPAPRNVTQRLLKSSKNKTPSSFRGRRPGQPGAE